MEKIMDKLEAFIGRYFYVTMFAVMIAACIFVTICENVKENRVYDIPEGVCYCPSCGTVMVLEGKAVEE